MRDGEKDKSFYDNCAEWSRWAIQQVWNNSGVIGAIGIIAYTGLRGFPLIQSISDIDAEDSEQAENFEDNDHLRFN